MIRRRPMLAASWAALVVVVLAALAVGLLSAEEQTPAERAYALTGQFACPRCAGQAVRDSNAGVAVEIRSEITRRVQSGQSDEEILRGLSDAYGAENLLTPASTGAASLVWAAPVALGILAFAGLGFAFSRWTPREDVAVDDADRELVAEALRRRHDAP